AADFQNALSTKIEVANQTVYKGAVEAIERSGEALGFLVADAIFSKFRVERDVRDEATGVAKGEIDSSLRKVLCSLWCFYQDAAIRRDTGLLMENHHVLCEAGWAPCVVHGRG